MGFFSKLKKSYIVALVVSMTLVVFAGFKFLQNEQIISSEIQKKAGFTIFITDETSDWNVDKQSVNLDREAGVLHMNWVKNDGSNTIIVTQQLLPSPFTDIPNYSTLFYSKLNQYQELQTPLGAVALTRPTEIQGGQSAVANVRGTLMFMHPEQDMTDADWKELFNQIITL